MKYTVIFHRTEEGLSVSVPGLPGCRSEGDTDEEALAANIQDAIQEYLTAATELSRNKETHEIEVGWMGRGISRTHHNPSPMRWVSRRPTHHNNPVALSLAPIITRTVFLSCGLLSIFPAMLGQNTKYRLQL